jgi:protein-disulfide isomerase
MSKNFWIILAVVLAAFAGLFFLMSSDDGNTSSESTTDILTVQSTDHKKGLEGSSVYLIEYADFQCPSCAAVNPVTNQMALEFGDQIEFVFRHFPLTSIHQNAMASHRAAEAAGNQGKFWEMHDILFERQQAWSSASNAVSIFEGYAQELELDMDQYRADASSEETSKIINQSVSGGLDVGVNGTPAFFLNGEQMPIPQTVDEYRELLQAAIDQANTPEDTAETTE